MKNEFNWFDNPKNLIKLKIISFIILAVSILAEFFIHVHIYYPWDKIPGFYALFGFVTCTILIIISKLLGKFWLKKGEDYYDK